MQGPEISCYDCSDMNSMFYTWANEYSMCISSRDDSYWGPRSETVKECMLSHFTPSSGTSGRVKTFTLSDYSEEQWMPAFSCDKTTRLHRVHCALKHLPTHLFLAFNTPRLSGNEHPIHSLWIIPPGLCEFS